METVKINGLCKELLTKSSPDGWSSQLGAGWCVGPLRPVGDQLVYPTRGPVGLPCPVGDQLVRPAGESIGLHDFE